MFGAGLAVAAAIGAAAQYMVVDLRGGPDAASYPVERLDAVPAGGWTEAHKTVKLVLRRVPAGTFRMGTPLNRCGSQYFGRSSTPHDVTITKPFFVGVFEVTQDQWRHVMGTDPARCKGATRPVEQVSYFEIRGESAVAAWPKDGRVASGSFMGRLRARTGLAFDLPTESQWEYACRAGTDTDLNSGRNLTGGRTCTNMVEVGRYGFSPDADDGPAPVGLYRPNAWGLYDMHGNVAEWCLDWWQEDWGETPRTDPPGPETGAFRVLRGGCWDGTLFAGHAAACTSGARASYESLMSANPMNASLAWGLRVVCPAAE